jgi:membrane-bound metal-dependent hydrolase YbcI (DUF457 family)
MLPPGHIAAGYLTAYALIKITKPDLDPSQINQLLLWGMWWGFAPDLDNFVAFLKIKSWWYKPGNDGSIHRKFYSHIPLLWIIPGLAIYFIAQDPYIKLVGLLVWLGSWSHFLLDSIEFGVMWLWPWNKEVWALKDRGVTWKFEGNGFVNYWANFLKAYSTKWTCYAEIIILISWAVIFLNH